MVNGAVLIDIGLVCYLMVYPTKSSNRIFYINQWLLFVQKAHIINNAQKCALLLGSIERKKKRSPTDGKHTSNFAVWMAFTLAAPVTQNPVNRHLWQVKQKTCGFRYGSDNIDFSPTEIIRPPNINWLTYIDCGSTSKSPPFFRFYLILSNKLNDLLVWWQTNANTLQKIHFWWNNKRNILNIDAKSIHFTQDSHWKNDSEKLWIFQIFKWFVWRRAFLCLQYMSESERCRVGKTPKKILLI